jgi:hypothetical protein
MSSVIMQEGRPVLPFWSRLTHLQNVLLDGPFTLFLIIAITYRKISSFVA